VLRALRPIVAGIAVALFGSACTVATVETPDPGAVPSGEPTAHGPAASGPVTVVGSSVAEGLGWRLVVYESADGLCEQLELAEVITTGCGDLLPADDDAIGSVTVEDPLGNGVTPVHGIVTDEIFTVWIIDQESGGRLPATLMPLGDAGLDGQAFAGFLPAGAKVTHIQALARSGEILQTYEVP
jgi:hypothetical protein